MPAISEKNTKTEILSAYQEIIKQLKEQKKDNKVVEKKDSDTKEVVKIASSISVEDIVRNTAQLKLDVIRAVESLEEKVVSEKKKLADIQEAIDSESKLLDDLYDIKVEAESLEALRLTEQEISKTIEERRLLENKIFDEKMLEKRTAWTREQEEFEQKRKERDSNNLKSRTQEEEDYLYNRNKLRRDEQDKHNRERELEQRAFDEKITLIEKDIEVRQKLMLEKENEYNSLKEQVAAFPAQLEKAVKDAEGKTRGIMSAEAKREADFNARELAAEHKLHETEMKNLQTRIADLEAQNIMLLKKADAASEQVQNIAVSAIKGAQPKIISTNSKDKDN